MKDLYSKFDEEYSDLIRDSKFLLSYLSESYFGSEEDLKRIRTFYREVIDTKTYFINKNAVCQPHERAWREDFRDKEVFLQFIKKQIDPLVEMFQFIIELYEDDLKKR